MPPLPIVSGREVVRAFEGVGWREVRRRGSHMILVRDGSLATLSIPDHKEIAVGTLRKLIRRADVTVEQFLSALR